MKKENKLDILLHGVGGVAVVFTCVVLFNIVSAQVKFRADFTEGKVFTLSEGTRNILKDLDKDRGDDSESAKLKIRFFRTKGNNDVPIMLSSFAQRVEDLLDQYKETAGSNLELEKINPSPDTDEEDLAVKDGISSIQGIFYLGMSISYLDSVETLPSLDPRGERSLEYDISRRITKVLKPKKTVVGVMSSLNVWGGPDMSNPMAMMNRGQQQPAWVFVQQLRQDYDVQQIQPAATEIDKTVDVLLVIHPKSLSEQTEYALDQFVLRGGRLIAFVDPLATRDDSGNQNPQMRIPGLGGGSTLERLFKAWNLTFDNSQVIADLKYQPKNAQGRDGQPMVMPAYLLLDKSAVSKENLITSQINTLHLPYVGHFKRNSGVNDGLESEILLKSSKQSKLVDGMSSQFNGQDIIDKFGTPAGTEHIIAMHLEGKFKTAFPDGKPAAAEGDDKVVKENDDSKKDHLSESAEENAVLLIGDTDLLVNETSVRVQRTIFGNQVQMINGNLAFVQNAVEIMGGDSNLITVRSREDQNRPFEKINEMQEEATKKFNAELKRAQEKLESIVAEKSKMEQNNNQGENQVLTIKINQEDLKQIRKQEAEAQRQIRQVRKDLRKDIDRLQLRLQLANVGVIPLLIIISGIVFFFIKRRKTAAV